MSKKPTPKAAAKPAAKRARPRRSEMAAGLIHEPGTDPSEETVDASALFDPKFHGQNIVVGPEYTSPAVASLASRVMQESIDQAMWNRMRNDEGAFYAFAEERRTLAASALTQARPAS